MTTNSTEAASPTDVPGERPAKPNALVPSSASEPHPIAAAVDILVHRMRDIEVAARVHIPLSVERKRERLEQFKEELRQTSNMLTSQDESIRAHAIRRLQTVIRRVDRLVNSAVPEALQTSLFLGLFSAYDAFTGELLAAIYSRKPELFRSMKRTVEVGDILRYKSFTDLQNAVLQEGNREAFGVRVMSTSFLS